MSKLYTILNTQNKESNADGDVLVVKQLHCLLVINFWSFQRICFSFSARNFKILYFVSQFDGTHQKNLLR